jgi:hypothetical protein
MAKIKVLRVQSTMTEDDRLISDPGPAGFFLGSSGQMSLPFPIADDG